MYKYYSHGIPNDTTYESKEVTSTMAKLYSAIYQTDTDVVDMSTGEIIAQYHVGLLVGE